MDLKTVPKAELHCHLDGSLRLSTLQQLLHRPNLTQAEIQAPLRCHNLAEYLKKFDLPLAALQTEKHLEIAAHDLLVDMGREMITYAEIRFAPMLHMNAGLTCEQVIESVLCGLRQAEKELAAAKNPHPIKAQLIICAMRHHSFQQNLKALRAALSRPAKRLSVSNKRSSNAIRLVERQRLARGDEEGFRGHRRPDQPRRACPSRDETAGEPGCTRSARLPGVLELCRAQGLFGDGGFQQKEAAASASWLGVRESRR